MLLILLSALIFTTTQTNVKCTDANLSLTLIYNIDAQICPQNAYCLQNGFCDCNTGFIGNCTQKALRMQDQQKAMTQINSETYTFFEIFGKNETAIQLKFTMCLLDRIGYSNFYIDVWNDNGTIDTFRKQNAQIGGGIWSISESCLTLNTAYILFGLKTNGQAQSFILGIKKVQNGTQSISLTLTISEMDLWGLILRIVFRLGACFVLMLSAAIIYAIIKWKRRRRFQMNQNIEKDISHLQTFMPKIKLAGMVNDTSESELCSICLIELGKTSYLRKTVCFHIFHQDCLDSWCKSHLSCPVCRRSFQLKDLKNGPQAFDRNAENLQESLLR